MRDTLQFDVTGSSRNELKNEAEKMIRKYFNISVWIPVEQQVTWSMEVNPYIRGDEEIINWSGTVTANLKDVR